MALSASQLITIAALGLVSLSTYADVSKSKIQHHVDPETSIQSWILHDDGVEVELIQISPDQARGFFLGRGFDRKDADFYAESCVLATIVRNKSPMTVSYDLSNWRYAAPDGARRRLKLKDDWLHEWQQRGVSKSAQIAFEWSQHPSKQTLARNDWNQGMTTYQIAHGGTLDLTVEWNKGGKRYVDTIKGARCAK